MNRPEQRPEPLAGKVTVAGLTFDPARMEIRDGDGSGVPVPVRVFRVLFCLARHAGRTVPKQVLLDECWPDTLATEDSLTQAISEARRVLGPRSGIIRTIPRIGYLMTPDRAAEPEPAPPSGDPAVQAPGLLRRIGIPAAGALALVAGALLVLRAALFGAPEQGTKPPTLGVVTLANLSADPELAYFAAGTTDDLIGQLTRSPRLKVARVEAGLPRDRLEADGIDYLLEGSVQTNTRTMRLIARLVDTRTGENVWGGRFDTESEDPLQVQDRVVEEIVGSIGGEVGLIQKKDYERTWGSGSSSLGEYDYYLRGHQYIYVFTEDAVRKAIEIWSEGLSKYPDSGLLKIKLGFAHDEKFFLGFSADPKADLDRAYALATEGMLDPHLSPLGKAMGHWLLANLENDRNTHPAAAARHARLALDMMPYDPEARVSMAWAPIVEGKPHETLEWLEAFDQGLPDARYGNAYLAWAEFALGNLEAAIRHGRLAGAEPTYGQPVLVAALVEAGRLDEARRVVAEIKATFPTGTLDFYTRYHHTADPALNARELAGLRAAGLQ